MLAINDNRAAVACHNAFRFGIDDRNGNRCRSRLFRYNVARLGVDDSHALVRRRIDDLGVKNPLGLSRYAYRPALPNVERKGFFNRDPRRFNEQRAA